MPAGVLFLVILVSTTLEVLADRTRTDYREKRLEEDLARPHHRLRLRRQGPGGDRDAARARTASPATIVVIDERADVVEEARRAAATPGIVADASASARARGGRDPRGRRRRSSRRTATTPPCSSRSPRASSTRACGSSPRCGRPRTRTCSSRAARTPSWSPRAPRGGCSATPCTSPRVVQVLEDLLSVRLGPRHHRARGDGRTTSGSPLGVAACGGAGDRRRARASTCCASTTARDRRPARPATGSSASAPAASDRAG